MCRLYASEPPENYAYETRSIRLNGQSTSIRLERFFWTVLQSIADAEGCSVPRFISTLHSEILMLRGEASNFTSHLRCICLTFLDREQRVAKIYEPVAEHLPNKAAMRPMPDFSRIDAIGGTGRS